MEFNWADPRKNKRVDTVMMAKAEASRVKRLTSVKSTVSNQLNPAVEHKLKTLKKKKVPDERPSSRLHQRELDLGPNNFHPPTIRTGSSNNHSFYNEFLPRPTSIFDGFDVHAAADGLFHPASNVQAFAEHDARFATTTKPSEPARLPPLSGNSDRSRSESRLPTTSSTSSLSRHSTGNRSDGNLHAPRRVGIVPSSADCHAMALLDELEHEDHHEEDEPQALSPLKMKPQSRITTPDNNCEHREVPPLELDLTQKFAKLKLLIQTNRDKERNATVPQGPEVDEDEETKEQTKTKKPKAKRAIDKKQPDKAIKLPSAVDKMTTSHAVVVAPHKPTTKAVHSGRHGVSLSDLKEEHRAARAMLRELGGPLQDPNDTTKKKKTSTSRSGRSGAVAMSESSANHNSRLVDKLRSRMLSGRDKASPRADDATRPQGKELVTAALDAARVALENQPPAVDDVDERVWQQYENDDLADEEEEEEEDISATLYDDEGFEV